MLPLKGCFNSPIYESMHFPLQNMQLWIGFRLIICFRHFIGSKLKSYASFVRDMAWLNNWTRLWNFLGEDFFENMKILMDITHQTLYSYQPIQDIRELMGAQKGGMGSKKDNLCYKFSDLGSILVTMIIWAITLVTKFIFQSLNLVTRCIFSHCSLNLVTWLLFFVTWSLFI